MILSEKISPTALIHPGCQILGDTTSIGPGCEIGAEAPVTLKDCQLGRNVKLKGGYFEGAVFMDGSGMGSGAHVRAGTILEEESNGAHTVGLKQTILMPFVTLGSLINFCDVLMAGGTSRKNHSEVGSSYIHFNFTPHQDKATASLVGDVPRGVLLNEKPIFLGGQGGLVGPSRIAYGSVIAAGGICRRDLLEIDQLYIPPVPAEKMIPFVMGRYSNLDRVLANNLAYIGNIKALRAWYENIRVLFVRDEFDQAVLNGALANFELILEERIKRMDQLASIVSNYAEDIGVSSQQRSSFPEAWRYMRERLEEPLDTIASAALMTEVESAGQTGYIAALEALGSSARAGAVAWLQEIVDETVSIRL